VFYAVYKGAALVRSGYQDFTILMGTNDYSFTGLTTPSVVGTDYTFRIGYEAGSYVITSAQFELEIPI